jgi:hypothetical protein
MAISLEELALGALEGSAGPWTLAVGAGALAVALAAGSVRPVRRMASTGAFVVQRNGQLNVAGWIGSARQSWRDLVAEARAEYESERQTASEAEPLVRRAADFSVPFATSTPVKEEAAASAPDPAAATPEPDADGESDSVPRDRRGRFVRRAATTNGTRSE